MKTFPIIVEFPDNYEDVDVLMSIAGNLPINSYEEVGIRFKTNTVLTERLKVRQQQVGLMSMAHPSKTKS